MSLKARRILGVLLHLLAILLVIVGLVEGFYGNYSKGVWFFFVGYFLSEFVEVQQDDSPEETDSFRT